MGQGSEVTLQREPSATQEIQIEEQSDQQIVNRWDCGYFIQTCINKQMSGVMIRVWRVAVLSPLPQWSCLYVHFAFTRLSAFSPWKLQFILIQTCLMFLIQLSTRASSHWLHWFVIIGLDPVCITETVGNDGLVFSFSSFLKKLWLKSWAKLLESLMEL